MIEAVIFDMDGVLIDSEPLWREAEKEIFKKVGIELTTKMCIETAGLPIREVVRHWYSLYPWDGITIGEIAEEVDQKVTRLIIEKGEPLPGVYNVIDFLNQKGVPKGLASSSSPAIISAVLEKLGLEKEFLAVNSAVHEEYGKPHPAVFISAAKQLGKKPERCLAVEDSVNGLIAAKAAKMKTVAVPESGETENPKYCIADLKLESLEQFSQEHWKMLNSPPPNQVAKKSG